MLTLPPSTRVFVATKPADMRRSFDGLLALVRDFLGHEDPLAGHLFVFRNKSGDRIKVIWWDIDGLAIFYKNHEPDCTHSLPFTEFIEHSHNLARRSAAPGGMDSNTPGRSSRR
jgi:transposase